jgi:hypothetical protein
MSICCGPVGAAMHRPGAEAGDLSRRCIYDPTPALCFPSRDPPCLSRVTDGDVCFLLFPLCSALSLALSCLWSAVAREKQKPLFRALYHVKPVLWRAVLFSPVQYCTVLRRYHAHQGPRTTSTGWQIGLLPYRASCLFGVVASHPDVLRRCHPEARPPSSARCGPGLARGARREKDRGWQACRCAGASVEPLPRRV